MENHRAQRLFCHRGGSKLIGFTHYTISISVLFCDLLNRLVQILKSCKVPLQTLNRDCGLRAEPLQAHKPAEDKTYKLYEEHTESCQYSCIQLSSISLSQKTKMTEEPSSLLNENFVRTCFLCSRLEILICALMSSWKTQTRALFS